MADWKAVSAAALLADGNIDTKEVKIIEKYIFADGKVDRSELQFLAHLRKHATSAVKAFYDLYFRAVKEAVLADGHVSPDEAKYLRKLLMEDGKIDANEKAFIAEIKAAAKSTCPEFDALAAEVAKA